MVTISRGIKWLKLKLKGSEYSVSRNPHLFFFAGGLFLGFVFLVGDFHAAGAIDSAELAELAAAQGAVALELGLGFDGEAGPGNRIQASLGNGLAGQFADAVSALLNALERFLDLV